MSEYTADQILAELKRRGASDEHIGLATLDKQSSQLRSWLQTNAFRKGTDDYNKVSDEFMRTWRERADAFARFQEVQTDTSTPLEKVGALGKGVITEGAGPLAGAGVGFAVGNVPGALAGLAIGTGVPADIVNLGLEEVGLGTEEPVLGSQNIRRNLEGLGIGYTDRGDLPPSQRSLAAAGETIGASLSMYAPVGLAARGMSAADIAAMRAAPGGAIRKTGREFVATAAERPLASAALEGTTAAMAGGGAFAAESIDPGDPTTRMLMEFGAPLTVMGSSAILSKLVRPRGEKVVDIVRARLPGGLRGSAALKLQQSILDAGEDPKAIAAAISSFISSNPKSVLSPGMMTKSPALLDIERSLIHSDKTNIGPQAAKQTEGAIKEMNQLYSSVLKLKDPDPELLREVAQMRVDVFNAAVDKRVGDAVRTAEGYSKGISGVTPSATKKKIAAGAKAKKLLDEVHTDLKGTENSLWGQVDKTVKLDGGMTDAALRELAKEPEGLSGIRMTQALKGLRKNRQGADWKGLKSEALLKARSDLLRQARHAGQGPNPNYDLRRRLNKLADGVMRDLEDIGGPQLELARAATRKRVEFEHFGVVNKLRKLSSQGRQEAPEVVLDTALGMGKTGGFRNFDDLVVAVGGRAEDMKDPLRQFYNAMARETLTQDNTVDVVALGKFLTKHEEGLKELGLYDYYKQAHVQVGLVKKLEESARRASLNFKSKQAASRILDVPQVDKAVSKTLFESTNRGADLRKMARLATGSKDPRVLEGLQQAVVDQLVKAGSTPNTPVSGVKMANMLDAKQGKNTLRQDLINSRILRRDQLDGIDDMIKRAGEFEEALVRRHTGGPIPGIPGKGDLFIDLTARILGATVAELSPMASSIGHSLIIAGAGAQAGSELLAKMPQMKLREVLGDAMLDPKLMKALLERPTSAQAVKTRDRRLLFYLISNDLIAEKDAYDVEEFDYSFDTRKAVDKMLAGTAARYRGKKWTPVEIMDYFEGAAREPRSRIGPFNLNSIQAYLDIPSPERVKIQEKWEKRNKPYTLKPGGERGLRRPFTP